MIFVKALRHWSSPAALRPAMAPHLNSYGAPRLVEQFLFARLYLRRLFKRFERANVEAPTYREFCRRIAGEMQDRANRRAGRKSYTAGASAVGSLISRFRGHVYDSELGPLFRRTNDPINVGRALRIPEFIPVLPSFPLKCMVGLLAGCMSERVKVLVAARMLSTVGTSEGKSHVYGALVYLLCGDSGRRGDLCRYWSDQHDFLLAEFRNFHSPQQLQALAALPLPLLRAGKRLGLNDPAQLLEELRPLKRGISAQAVLILAEEGVLATGFHAVRPYVEEDSFRYHDESLQEAEFRETVRILKCNGVSPDTLLGILRQTRRLDPSRLQVAIELLAQYGIGDLNTLYAGLGEQLWTLTFDVLRFLLADVGIRDAALLTELGQLLRQRRAPALPVINTIVKHAGHARALIQVQKLLSDCTGNRAIPVHRLDLLLSAPHSLTLAQLNKCTQYLTTDVDSDVKFLAFLEVLRRHGLGDGRDVLLFQSCFVAARSVDLFDQLIGLTRQHLPSIGIEALAVFIEQAVRARSASLLYLLDESNVQIKEPGELEKVIRLGAVSTDVLRYLVTERQLCTVASMGRWFYKEGEGIQAYSGPDTYGDLERELFVDCSRRKAFFRLAQNVQAVVNAIARHASSRLPEWSAQSSQEARDSWWKANESYRDDAKASAVPFVRRILERTDGIVLAGALEAALLGNDLEDTLKALEPMLSGLLMGRGPDGATVSPMEAETIGLIYGVTEQQVESHWREVTGCQQHLGGVKLEDRYPMVWSKKRYRLPDFDDRQLQALTANFGALSRAAARARQLKSESSIAELVPQFRTKPLKNDAAGAAEISDWLGLILLIGIDEPVIGNWVDVALDSYADFLDRPDEAHKRILGLQTFMSTTLLDEFKARVIRFVRALDDREVFVLSGSLGFLLASPQDMSQREIVVDALRALSNKVFAVFTNWVSTVQQKFESEKIHLPEKMRVHGVVTKYPAAYFARYKFGLCTRANTEMWREKRHSHFVVFDDASTTLVGMAMVYIQPIPGHFGGKDCLVIRAVNVRSPDEIQVDACSAIDEIMRVAVHIARQNGHAAVLFPWSSTYFSNQPFVDKALSGALYTAKARPLFYSRSVFDPSPTARTLFWCKTEGSSDGAVSELFVVWTADSDAEESVNRTVASVA